MKHYRDHSLKPYNSFGITCICRDFYTLESEQDFHRIRELCDKAIILGGGSNILFRKSQLDTVVFVGIKGIEIIEEDAGHIFVNIGAGENWHQFVRWCVDNEYGGVENLSLIPGSVGAAPIQNIGAYGVEIKEVFEGLYALDIHTGEKRYFNLEDCCFDYRYSIFKGDYKNRYLITDVQLRLTKRDHRFQTGYDRVSELINTLKNGEMSIRNLSDVIIEIRQSKLPDPAELGNCGSFFKNALISESKYYPLVDKYPEMPAYPMPDGSYKIPSAWLIEECGWKGKKRGNAGVYYKHALVIVNLHNATGEEIYQLARSIQQSVEEEFGIQLIPEVNII